MKLIVGFSGTCLHDNEKQTVMPALFPARIKLVFPFLSLYNDGHVKIRKIC